MNESTFDCEHFLSLCNDELVTYAEPFVTTQAEKVPGSAYDILANRFDQMSDVHKVYALEICMRLAPEKFVGQAIEFLAHTDSAVCCTASRLLEAVSPELVSDNLIKRISETPVVELFATHVRTGERVRIGTNKEFIRTLLGRLRQQAAD